MLRRVINNSKFFVYITIDTVNKETHTRYSTRR